jgi:hypothetical protein
VPFKKGAHDDVKFYQNYWQGRWKCNLIYLMQWVDIDSIACSFLVRKNTTMNNTITINDLHGSWAKTNIDVVNVVTTYKFDHHDN